MKVNNGHRSHHGYTLFEVFVALAIIAWLVLMGGLIYVVHHFIVKYW